MSERAAHRMRYNFEQKECVSKTFWNNSPNGFTINTSQTEFYSRIQKRRIE